MRLFRASKHSHIGPETSGSMANRTAVAWMGASKFDLPFAIGSESTCYLEVRSTFRNWPATNSGSICSSFCDNQTCSSDLCSSDTDTKRTPRFPVFDQQIVDS